MKIKFTRSEVDHIALLLNWHASNCAAAYDVWEAEANRPHHHKTEEYLARGKRLKDAEEDSRAYALMLTDA